MYECMMLAKCGITMESAVSSRLQLRDQFDMIPFESLDGFPCNLWHLRQTQPATKGPVMLVHGAGVRANIFNPPTSQNLITMLAEAGYDVWLENWRGSIDLTPNHWNLDVVARNDHPVAVSKVLELTGAKSLKAIIHCQGSTSFMISAMLGLIPGVDTIISNAVSLHPVVPRYSKIKLNVYVPMVKPFFAFINPQWGLKATSLKSWLLRLVVKATHWEKDTLVGKFVSFTYGAGFPALWRLENLDTATMDWIQYEFADVPMTFFDHITQGVKSGHLVPLGQPGSQTYLPAYNASGARIVLFAGARNQCFLAESQRKTFEYLEKIDPGRHTLHIFETYSHLDVFLGKNAHQDVFPLMLTELNQNS